MKAEKIYNMTGETHYSKEMWKTIPVALALLGALLTTSSRNADTESLSQQPSAIETTEPYDSFAQLQELKAVVGVGLSTE